MTGLTNGWTAQYKTNETTTPVWGDITNIQTITISVGRTIASDSWPVSTAQIRAWYPTGFSSPWTNLKPGQNARIFAPGRTSPNATWTGRIKNVTVEIGVPWIAATSTGNADFLTIDLEGNLAAWGRGQSTVNTGVAGSVLAAFSAIAAGINYPSYYERGFGSFYSSPEIKWGTSPGNETDNSLNLCNIVSTSVNGRIIDGIRTVTGSPNSNPAIEFVSLSALRPAGVVFSDTVNDSTHRVIESVVFEGLADDYFTKVIVTPSAISPVTAGTGSRVLNIDTVNSSSTTATDLANILYAQYGTQRFGLAQITAIASAQHTQNLDTLGATFAWDGVDYDAQLGELSAVQIAAEIRGTIYSGLIEGVTVNATPNDTRYTYAISNFSNSNWFTLNSNYFGVLDEDRLAWF